MSSFSSGRRVWLLAIILAAIGLLAALPTGGMPQAADSAGFEENRTRLLTYMLRRQLENHYSGKNFDDALSRDAYRLYLKQLDFQKRFLLDGEVRQLNSFENQIDDEIRSGRIRLVPQAEKLMTGAVTRAERLVGKLLGKPFDFTINEDYETDPEKQTYCRNESELTERWRKELKFRVLSRYLTLAEEAGFKQPSEIPKEKRAEFEAQAREKVAKQHRDYFSRLHQDTVQDQYDRYLNAVTRAFDPHTGYMPPQSKEDFDISMRGSLEGIGATLRDDEGYIRIVKIIPGSAADRQGQLQADDTILAVAQGAAEAVDVTDMRLRDAVALIRGKKGSEVRLTIKRPGHKNFVVPIIRDVVVIADSFVKSAVIKSPDGKPFGYIRIPSFYRDFEETNNGGGGRNSTDDVRAALRSLKLAGIDGLILDLRNNGGGALTDAVGVAGLFIDNGPVVQVRSSNGSNRVLADQDASVEYGGPMVVLVNQFSASASEIVAGALQDYRRAIVVGGEHTHGKGTVQVIMNLDESMPLRNMDRYLPLGALKLTTQKFYRISGESTQYRGVVPDIVLPDRQQGSKYGERYLDFSLPWDTIGSVSHRDWSGNLPDVSQLMERSRKRVATDQGFTEIRHAAEIFSERLKNTRQSLQIDTVAREKSEMGNINSPHGEVGLDGPDGKEKDGKRPGETDEQKFVRLASEDPYTREGMAILGDILELSGSRGVAAR